MQPHHFVIAYLCLYSYTINREYFRVTKVTWAMCSMSFNFINLVGIQNLFNSKYFIKQNFSTLHARV